MDAWYYETTSATFSELELYMLDNALTNEVEKMRKYIGELDGAVGYVNDLNTIRDKLNLKRI